jgi:hypothetical protein
VRIWSPIVLQVPDLEIGLVVPKSRWDFSKRCFLTSRTSDDESWGLVEFRIPKEKLQYGSQGIGFCILFELLSRSISLLDNHKTASAIFRDREEWTFMDVVEHLVSSGDMRRKFCRDRVVRELAFLDRWQSIKYRKKAQVVAEISEARFGGLSLILTVKFEVV